MWEHGQFWWNELMTRDAEKAKAFYRSTLGWTFSEMPVDGGGTYWVANLSDKPTVGIFEMRGPNFDGLPEHWFSYIAVDNIDERLELAKAHGATVTLRCAGYWPDCAAQRCRRRCAGLDDPCVARQCKSKKAGSR